MKRSRGSRRLHRRHRQANVPAGLLNLTSMIDIFTVLLFFLLVYAAELAIFTPMSVLKLDLPAAQAAPAPAAPLHLEIVIRRDGLQLLRDGASALKLGYSTDGREYQALTQTLTQLKAQAPATREITLSPEPEVAYEILVRVMDATREAGLTGKELFPEVLMGAAPPLQ
jgi:biopolymer transport protein ExbD